ncbi:amidase [Phreatobacter cathodiphilus]|uniref:Amidase n=1 Tax=Phreatobacter cathodiphilus TaxID=1868589 RepID=A0A2S0N8I5_9HYPH|nr:amidase [Phreatobacter cathodiphilus]AVO44426.1 amidase [Phreatobacter cathodiphilus]
MSTAVRDALEASLARIDDPSSDGRVTFTKVYAERARAEADAADARAKAGVKLSPLDGWVISIKDLFDVAGEVTTAGSVILKSQPPAAADAPTVARLRQAGVVIVGKTNMSEFAFSGIGINPHFGTPGNAADKSRVPGGSSSGAGVSAAEGTVRMGLGSDTGGSIRIPAALNGCVGFKPTYGRIPLEGAFPLSYALDTIGPLAKTVADCAATDAVLAGEQPWTPTPAPLAGLRLAIPRGRLFGQIEPEVEQAFEAAASRLGKAGARITDISIEDLLQELADAMARAPFVAMEAAAIHAEWMEERARDFDPRVLARIRIGAKASAPDYIRLVNKRAELVARMRDRLADIDALILPTTPIRAPKISDLIASDDQFWTANGLMLRNTTVGNIFTFTGISIPCPKVKGLPVGFMMTALAGQDRRLLRMAAAVEQAFTA